MALAAQQVAERRQESGDPLPPPFLTTADPALTLGPDKFMTMMMAWALPGATLLIVRRLRRIRLSHQWSPTQLTLSSQGTYNDNLCMGLWPCEDPTRSLAQCILTPTKISFKLKKSFKGSPDENVPHFLDLF